MYSFILNFVDQDKCLLFPQDDLLRANVIAANKEIEAQQIYVLNKLLSNNKYLIITNTSGLIKRLTSKEKYVENTFKINVGDDVDYSTLAKKLSVAGYQRVNKVSQSLQYSLRGEILDIFSINYAKPIRIDAPFDNVHSISYFDIATQRSLESLDSVTILPANEIIYSDNDIAEIEQQIQNNFLKYEDALSGEEKEKLLWNLKNDIEHLKLRENTQKAYQYSQFCNSAQDVLLDYIKEATLVIVDKDQVYETHDLLLEEQKQFYDELVSENKTIRGLEHYVSLEKAIKKASNKIYINAYSSSPKDIPFKFNYLRNSINNLDTLLLAIDDYRKHDYKVIITIDNKIQLDNLKEKLSTANIAFDFGNEIDLNNKKTHIMFGSLPSGFELEEEKLVFITSKEIFNVKQYNSRFVGQFRSGEIIQNFDELQPGDYVVHEYYGIGQYVDIVTRVVNGVHRDYLHIAYAGTDTLYTPLEQFHLIRKYAGREGARPKLNSLGSNKWDQTKKKISKRIDEITDVLLENQAKRIKRSGFAFPADDEFQIAFENQFPYELTIDQKQALEEIKLDMEKPTPMDRLLCGDVGFGKTEIAFRAAFKAISAGKMVALLCPTTLLARQHYEVALERFKGFDINIAHLSRLVPETLQKAVINDVNSGKIHFLIGTHRLLNSEIDYSNLGLLIVDEEQRFGVAQKEKIKTLCATTDILTLSATPIPRTLQMSLMGIRELSQINTPPQERMPIQIYVIPKKKMVIKELIERELQRKGQVFYLHNRIYSINSVARNIENQVKGATVGVVHGKMNKEDTEDVMMRFYDGEIDILVCTSIIENGIDVSNANLIIVDDAANFGLAQLYQIKGRVGRGNQIAYAYLLYSPGTVTETGKKRLKAIQDFAQLGSGYKVAQRDLMIRGAGDILGREQAGFIDSVGIEMYFKLVRDVMERKKKGEKEKVVKPVNMIDIDAYIPSDFVEKPYKIEIYQEIKQISSMRDLTEFEEKTRDIYGALPEEVELLFRKKRIDILIDKFARYISLVIDKGDYILIDLSKDFINIEASISNFVNGLGEYGSYLRLFPSTNQLTIKLNKKENWFDVYEKVIMVIGKIVVDSKNDEN